MEPVNELDIDGYRWEMQDVEARNRIAKLETKTNVKITNIINEEILLMNVIEINGEKLLQVKVRNYAWKGEDGELIASFRNDFGLKNYKRFFSNITSASGRNLGFVFIDPIGEVRFYPCFERDKWSSFINWYIFGETLLRVNDW